MLALQALTLLAVGTFYFILIGWRHLS